MIIRIEDLINKHKEQKALVILHGPSFNQHIDKINYYKDNGFIIFDCNEWFCFQNVDPHYWVLANNEYTIQKSYKEMNKYSSTILYSNSIDLTDKNFVVNNLQCNYLAYDSRHFKNNPCHPISPCCNNISLGKLTIQEAMQMITNYNNHYGSGDTVAVHMLAFAVLMGCNPIYVTGLDLDYTKGYARHQISINIPHESNNQYNSRIIRDLEIINESAKKININIINTNRDSVFSTLQTGDIT